MDALKIEKDASSSTRIFAHSALGAAFPVAIWTGSDLVVLTWYVRWAAAGLTAIKPVVLSAQDFVADAGKAVELC